jgi:hypothetical protein
MPDPILLLRASVLSLAVASVHPAWGKTYRAAKAADLDTYTPQLAPGDTLAVAPGNYDVETWNLSGRKGTADKPIVIRGEPGAVIRGTSDCCNLVQMDGVAHLEFRGFEITLRESHDGIDGINMGGGYSHHVTMEDLHIHGMTNSAISLFPDSAAFITLRHSEIDHTDGGSGLYWGYPGRNIVHDVVIEGNYIHHCPADPAEETGYGIQFKGWGYRARIVNNVLHDVGGTARSGLIVYYGKKPLAGDKPEDANLVTGNVLWNCRNEGITAMSDATLENNVVFSAQVGINLQTYSDESFSGSSAAENLKVRNNTVFRCADACYNISGWGSGANLSFTGNAAYQDKASAQAFSGSVGNAACAGNVGYGQGSVPGALKGTGLGDFAKVAAGANVPDLDFFPASASILLAAVPAEHCPADDFNGNPRKAGQACDAGAFQRTGNPPADGSPQAGFKDGGPSPVFPGGRDGKAPGRKAKARIRGGGVLFLPDRADREPCRADGRAIPDAPRRSVPGN